MRLIERTGRMMRMITMMEHNIGMLQILQQLK
jgi:hypothetical protein